MVERDTQTIALSRAEFAQVINLWGVFVARCLRPQYASDPAATAHMFARQRRAFLQAIDVQTGNPFLRDHAKDFTEAIEHLLFGEALKALLAEGQTIKHQQSQEARRRDVKVKQSLEGQVADSLDQPQATLSLRRRKAD